MSEEGIRDLPTRRPSQLDDAYHWFHRIVALACLAFGVAYWVRLLGFYPGLLWRFDLMPVHWQIAAVVLAVLYPFAAVGLWMIVSWGAVIWFLCAGAETAMHWFFDDYFGRRPLLLSLHLLVAFVYVIFRVAMEARRRRPAP